MYGLILSLGLATTGGAADFHHLRGGCAGLHARAGCTGAVAASSGCQGYHAAPAGCQGTRQGCHGGAYVSRQRTVTHTRYIAPVAAVPVPAAIPAPVAVVPTPPAPPVVVAPPAVMPGPANVYVVPRAAPVRDFAFFTGERAHALFGRVRGACGVGGCR